MCLALGACLNGRSGQSTKSADWSARCDAALERVGPAPVRSIPWTYTSDLTIGDEVEHPIGAVAGAAWDAADRRLYVFDGMNFAVYAYDAHGTLVSQFGRAGEGPGEFRHRVPVFATNHLARVGSATVAVITDRLHLFRTTGEFITRYPLDPPYYTYRPSIVPYSDSTILMASDGAWLLATNDRDTRTTLRLLEVTIAHGLGDPVELGRIRNPLALKPPPAEGRMLTPTFPYPITRRLWDALPTRLVAFFSMWHHGACFMGQDSAVRAVRINAPLVPTNDAERERVLAGRVGPVPMMGGTWQQFYEDTWPDHVPPYFDIALGPDSTAWLERILPGGERAIDLVHATRGYLGSMPPLGTTLPVTFDGTCVFIVHQDTTFYGLRRWCQTNTHR